MYFTVASRNLAQARIRTGLLGLALAVVTALLVLLLSLSQGISNTLITSATTLSAGHVNVAGFVKTNADTTAPMVTGVAELKKQVIEATEGVDFVIDRLRGWGRIVSEQSSINVGMTGIDVSEEGRFLDAIQLAKESEYKEGGRDELFGEPRKLADKNTALIFAAQAKRLGVEVGDALTVTVETFSGYTNSEEVTIVAVAKDVGMMSAWSVFLSKDTVRAFYTMSDTTTGAIMIYLDDPARAEAVMADLVPKLKAHGHDIMEHDPNPFWMKFDTVLAEDWLGQKLDLTVWRDEVSFLTWILKAVDGVSFLLISILLVIIAIGIMNAMWVSVRERTGEIGTLRAIGMSRGRVLVMFMTEALLLGLVATIIGAALGAVSAIALDSAHIAVPFQAVQYVLMSDTLHLSVHPWQLVGVVISFTLITGLSALWPAVRACLLQPVTAIQRVN